MNKTAKKGSTIEWNNKKYKIPFDIAYEVDSEGKAYKSYVSRGLNNALPFYKQIIDVIEGKQKIEVITNRFGGGSCSLPSFAVAIYDVIMGCEQLRMYNTQQKGLSWFSRNFTSQYMVLLD